MHIATFQLTGLKGSPLQFGRHHQTPKRDRELPDDYEQRTWLQKLHVDEEGFAFIPGVAFRAALADAAKFLGMQIPGRSRQTYTKHFESGLMIVDPVTLYTIRDGREVRLHSRDAEQRAVFGDARGKRRGGNPRVTKYFPTLLNWHGTLTVHVVDDLITQKVLMEHMVACGQFIGIGVYRPQNGGHHGQFRAELVRWDEFSLEDLE